MKCGDYVKVLGSRYKTTGLVGAVGKIIDYYRPTDTYLVAFDAYFNHRSKSGGYYFKPQQLQLFKGDEQIMEGNYTIANVRFIEGTNTNTTYRYACYDSSIEPGDICVVKSAHHGLGIARVDSIEPKTDEVITREIICKADFSAYETREANRKRAAVLKKKMSERANKLNELAMYAMLAKDDPEMQDLLTEFASVSNV